MKKLLLFLALITPCFGQQNSAQSGQSQPTPSFVTPDALIPFAFTAAGNSAAFDNRKVGCTSYHLWYWNTGSNSTSIQPQFAPDNSGAAGSFSNWSASQVIGTLPLTSTTESQITFAGFHPWIRVALGSYGAGGTTLNGFIACWRGQGSPEASNSTQPIQGQLTNNAAAPAANNLGVLPNLANAANPNWTEGDQVLGSVDLSGNQRVKVNVALPAGANAIGSVSATTSTPADATSNTSVPGFQNFGMIFNGSTWDRPRSVATGVAGVSLFSNGGGASDGFTNSSMNTLAVTNGASSPTANNYALIVGPLVFNGATWDRELYCSPNTPTVINPSTATTTLLLSAQSAKTNRICALEISSTGTQTVKIIAGTQTTNPCDTGAVTLSATYQLATNTNITVGGNLGAYLQGTTTNQQICVVTSAAVSVFVAARSATY